MSAAEPSPTPKHFSAYIGGFMGASYRLDLKDGILTYSTFGRGNSNPKHTTVTPTTEQWSEFRQALDGLKVWQWRADYPSTGTLDGTQWLLDVAYADHAIKTGGSNSYPDSSGKPSGKPEYTKDFSRYLEAVKKLIGGKSFE
jgi:hypothetical protein